MKIRPLRQADAKVVSDIHNALYPDDRLSPAKILQWLADGRVWVVEDEEVLGYTAVFPVPGLDGVGSITGGIAPKYQRQGLGTSLLLQLIPEAQSLGFQQLSHGVADLNTPGAHFLRHHNFFIEHEDWFLQLSPLLLRPPAPPLPDRLKIHSIPSFPERIFGQLYDRSFGGTAWYQHYTQVEIEETLTDPKDLLFLFKDGDPIGFAWLRMEKPEIEPMGIVKEEQGQGYGRILLLAALHEIKQRGANQTHIGVWRSNQAAIRLYQSVGFQHQQTLTYLACELED
jgi:ribosomal protein S18 acetylase RimI-like enzyme